MPLQPLLIAHALFYPSNVIHLRLQDIETSALDVVSEEEVKKTLLQEGILPPEDENEYLESQSSDAEQNAALWTKVPREMLESTALEAAQRYVGSF